jgi:hypothetical protein
MSLNGPRATSIIRPERPRTPGIRGSDEAEHGKVTRPMILVRE